MVGVRYTRAGDEPCRCGLSPSGGRRITWSFLMQFCDFDAVLPFSCSFAVFMQLCITSFRCDAQCDVDIF